MYVCMYICNVCMCVYVCNICMRMYVYMYVCMYVHMYVCMYTYIKGNGILDYWCVYAGPRTVMLLGLQIKRLFRS